MKLCLIELFRAKFNRFVLAGLVNTIFGYVLFSLLIYSNLDYKIALSLSYIFGISFNFINYKIFVFEKTYNFSSLVKYLALYIFTYSVNVYMLGLLFSLLHNFYLSQLLVLPMTVTITWIALNYWVFNK